MKRIIAVMALVVMFVMMFAACGGGKVGTCDLCGSENVNVRDITVEGETGWFCDSCYETAEYMANLASMGGL